MIFLRKSRKQIRMPGFDEFETQMALALSASLEEKTRRKEYTGDDYCVASLLACDQGGPSQQDLLDAKEGGGKVPEPAGGGARLPPWSHADDASARVMRIIEKHLPGGLSHPDAMTWATAIACYQSETADDDKPWPRDF